ncbi:MAG TPA: PhnD/SsuA/transferrin family substrate-binding protein, partial [Alkalispirochaeta sp.]|nr:PhnD/SsuA/transferrin family substrate-binding protein [Alkalispirochaeta sp.]
GYEQILQAFVDGDIDLAYLGPLPMIALQNDFPQAVPVVAFRESDGTTCYRCVLVESDGADQADERREANSTPVALTQPLSTCGYLSTMWLLNRRGLAMDSGDYTYVGSHEAVALAVARNEATVGGMKDTIAERYRGIGVRITDRTRRLPGFTMVANGATVSAHQIRAIRAALLQHDRDDLAGLDVGRYGFARPDEEAFRRVIDMLNESGISVSVQGMVQ